ncbi:hypothetical protein FRC11_008118 [Ceratobasidium sp. 423]|nr:hypothetical protein FRC11_008118 [Ceratobasidium sp. 423]
MHLPWSDEPEPVAVKIQEQEGDPRAAGPVQPTSSVDNKEAVGLSVKQKGRQHVTEKITPPKSQEFIPTDMDEQSNYQASPPPVAPARQSSPPCKRQMTPIPGGQPSFLPHFVMDKEHPEFHAPLQLELLDVLLRCQNALHFIKDPLLEDSRNNYVQASHKLNWRAMAVLENVKNENMGLKAALDKSHTEIGKLAWATVISIANSKIGTLAMASSVSFFSTGIKATA